MSRPDNATVNGATVTNIPGGNSRGTQRPDLVPGVDPYLKNGVRWLNPAAFATPQPGTFGNLPRNFLRGPSFWQADLMVSKDFRFAQLRRACSSALEIFNIANRLNYENPAATLPNGTPGAPITDAQAGTFGYMLGPAQPHGRARHRATDAVLAALQLLRLGLRACGLRARRSCSPPPSGVCFVR